MFLSLLIWLFLGMEFFVVEKDKGNIQAIHHCQLSLTITGTKETGKSTFVGSLTAIAHTIDGLYDDDKVVDLLARVRDLTDKLSSPMPPTRRKIVSKENNDEQFEDPAQMLTSFNDDEMMMSESSLSDFDELQTPEGFMSDLNDDQHEEVEMMSNQSRQASVDARDTSDKGKKRIPTATTSAAKKKTDSSEKENVFTGKPSSFSTLKGPSSSQIPQPKSKSSRDVSSNNMDEDKSSKIPTNVRQMFTRKVK